MPNSFFKFKQFIIEQGGCAMKVGTDGVLLGAWTQVEPHQRVLDIGTGTGLIALMLAQRTAAPVTAIDVDADAVQQATQNVLASPWADRVEIKQADAQTFTAPEKYDLVVSNPPYFQQSLKCPDGRRAMARHTDSLSFHDLCACASRCLTAEGSFSVVLPADAAQQFILAAATHSLWPLRKTWVVTKEGVPPKRVLMQLGHRLQPCAEDSLLLELPGRVRSPQYAALTREYYL